MWKMPHVNSVVQKRYTERRENVQSYVPRWRKIWKLACFLVDTKFRLNRNVKQPKRHANKAYALITNIENLYLQIRIAKQKYD